MIRGGGCVDGPFQPHASASIKGHMKALLKTGTLSSLIMRRALAIESDKKKIRGNVERMIENMETKSLVRQDMIRYDNMIRQDKIT